MIAKTSAAALAAVLIAGACGAAQAQSVPPSVVVLAHAKGIAAGLFSPEQERAIEGIAYQSAVARTCSGFAINMQAYQGAVNALATTDDDLTDEQATFRDRMIMAVLGMATGGFIAEFAADPNQFCQDADAFRTEFKGDTLFGS